jgi:hypothetical protein
MPCEHFANSTDRYLNERPDGKCRICRSLIMRKHYLNNKSKVLEKATKYRLNNADKVKEIKKRYNERITKVIRESNIQRNKYATRLREVIIECRRIIWQYKKHF